MDKTGQNENCDKGDIMLKAIFLIWISHIQLGQLSVVEMKWEGGLVLGRWQGNCREWFFVFLEFSDKIDTLKYLQDLQYKYYR